MKGYLLEEAASTQSERTAGHYYKCGYFWQRKQQKQRSWRPEQQTRELASEQLSVARHWLPGWGAWEQVGGLRVWLGPCVDPCSFLAHLMDLTLLIDFKKSIFLRYNLRTIKDSLSCNSMSFGN